MITIDSERGEVVVGENGERVSYSIASPEAFMAVSKAWLRVGWDVKHVYTFTWLGRPIIQLPEDMIRIQEVIYEVQPDIIIETGVAHGGSLIFYAGLLTLMGKDLRGKSQIIGVDVEIRPHNRAAIESHPLAHGITLIEGNSVAPEVVARVQACIPEGSKVFVILDALHTKEHVLAELQAYSPWVTAGSYIVAADGIMKDLVDAPRSHEDWAENNPYEAARLFASQHPEFALEQPRWAFNESHGLTENITYWPGGWLKRLG